MGEWPVHDNVFPFVCENASCAKEFDQFEFTTAINTGYVRLTNEEFTFLGLVCPKCHHFTMRKYNQDAIKSANLPDFGQPCYVPFPIESTVNLSDKNENSVFTIPRHIPILNLSPTHIQSLEGGIEYPEWFLKQCRCSFTESDIEKLVAYENEHQIKVFPRIVEPTSVYGKTDIFLTSVIAEIYPTKDTDKISLNNDRVWCQIAGIAKDHYLSGAETSITESEYKDLAIEFIAEPDYDDDAKVSFQKLLQEYIEKRKDFHFDRIWKTGFLDKYIKQLFYHEGYFGSDQYYQDKWEYEEIFGKLFKGAFKKLDRSQLKERLTCKQISEMLGMEPALLTNFIIDGDLAAYNPDGSYFDPHSQSVPKEIDPEKFIYLKSEIDELIRRHPWIIEESRKAVDDEQTSSENISKKEYARLLFEEDQWDASIKAAVEIGLECEKNDTKFSYEGLINFIDNISPASPISTIETIWESLPMKFKKLEEKLEAADIIYRKNNEYHEYLSDLDEIGMKRNIKQKNKVAEKRYISIKAALYLAMAVQQAGGKFRSSKLDTAMEKFDKRLNGKLPRRIYEKLPLNFRPDSGNPGISQRDEVSVLIEKMSEISKQT